MILKNLKQKIALLKQECIVIYFALKDIRTPFPAKIFAAVTVAYLLSPMDLVPDFIPVLGLLDDLILVPLLISLTLKLIPKAVLDDVRAMVNKDGRLRQQWYFALPVVLIYAAILSVLYFKVLKRV